MKNQQIAEIFYEIADFLEMEGVSFKPYAYRKAAVVLEALEEDAAEIYKKGGRKDLEKISGIGKGISEKIEEYLKTGKINYYLALKKKTPIDLESMIAVEGVGPKKAKVLYQKLGVRNLKELKKAAKAGKIASLFGFDEKTEKNILEGIAFLEKGKSRFLLGEVMPDIQKVYYGLKELKGVQKIDLAGSVRRMKETVGDIDFLVVSKNPDLVMDFFTSLPGIVKIWQKGKTKSSVRTKKGFDMDIRVVPQRSYGSALQYFTGSKEHNIIVRKIAIEKGLKLSEYGLFKKNKIIAGSTEKGVYKALGMDWVDPELRENQGEIELALEGKLPDLVLQKDIKGDLHCHSEWNGGASSIKEMAETAFKMGYQYIGISDHTKFLKIENGLDEKQLAEQRKEIEKLNEKLKNKNFKILQGCEVNILKDGSLDIKNKYLAKLDYVIAGIHSAMKMEKKEMTERMVRAMENPEVDIISHPTGRLLQRREAYQIDFDKILEVARKTKTILEINSNPQRLDLNDQNIKKAKEAGVKMVINTDSHHKSNLSLIDLGVAQARRGWAEKKDIVNTEPLNKLLEFFK